MKDWVGVVLVAGEGQRMRSQIPKVLHPVCGKPMVLYSVEALRKAGIEDIVLVVSPHRAKGVRQLFGDSVRYVEQDRPLGTGHALLQCKEALENDAPNLVVMGGDSPLIESSTIKALTVSHLNKRCKITLLTSTTFKQEDLGRLHRDDAGRIVEIVEATEDKETDSINEVNAGVYCLDSAWLWSELEALSTSPGGEYYLTSLVAVAASKGQKIYAADLANPDEAIGINDRMQLAVAEALLRQRIREHWMREGVTIMDPSSTFIDAEVALSQDTIIYPNTCILGPTKIGPNCQVGPNTTIISSLIAERCSIIHSVIEESVLEQEVDAGPFSHIRRGTYLESNVHIGNFVEVKASRLGTGVKMGHFGYVGDAQIGPNTNLGAGLVTCNFDGVSKHHTEIGEGAFIGSDTMLVAPVKVGDGASTGAGAVITKDVPPYRLAVGVPARIRERPP